MEGGHQGQRRESLSIRTKAQWAGVQGGCWITRAAPGRRLGFKARFKYSWEFWGLMLQARV